jgi:hypothetical protein
MVMRYHWGCGVGHTYAYSARTVTEEPGSQAAAKAMVESMPDEINDQENNHSQRGARPPVDDGYSSDGSSMGEDDMIFPHDSDGSLSEDDDEE